MAHLDDGGEGVQRGDNGLIQRTLTLGSKEDDNHSSLEIFEPKEYPILKPPDPSLETHLGDSLECTKEIMTIVPETPSHKYSDEAREGEMEVDIPQAN